MNKYFATLLLSIFIGFAKAQTPEPTDPYGKVNQADLDLKTCDFEKDANAEILFDKAKVIHDGNVDVMERHIRIKILNDFGKDFGNVRVEYFSYMGATAINDLQAETINYENGKTVITQLDKKSVYSEKTDKYLSTLVFALPDVKVGSIIEYKYRYALNNAYFPTWYFQSNIPTRYSEIQVDIPPALYGTSFRLIPHVKQDFAVSIGKPDDTKQVRALANVHSLPDEPYMSSRYDNLQRLEYLGLFNGTNTWDKIGKIMTSVLDVGQQFNVGLADESGIIKQAKKFKTDDEKIAFVFDTVRNSMKWNDISLCYTIDGTARAWSKKTGNSAEINYILLHLLRKTGINAHAMIVSTKKHGRVNPFNPNINLFNSAVVYIPVDSSKCYVLDATNKYNLYNTIPTDELNTNGLNLDEDNQVYKTIFLESDDPAIQSIFLNAEVKPGGKMEGTAQIASYSYNRSIALKKYKTDGEQKYVDYLRNGDNAIKISALKLENMDADSLPLAQKFNFNIDLTGSDENYIIFNPGVFNLMGPNPFVKEDRYADIDFGYLDNYSINGVYKIPDGYKAEALPKNISIILPDKSITFKRMIIQQDGSISVRYTLTHRKTIYFTENYQDLRGFYKQLYELLNDQIVLKKI